MKESFFKERGIYYRMSEMRPDLPTILFIHGLSGSSSVWIPYERTLESTHNILSLDLRGHGKSFKKSRYEDYELEKVADDISALMDTLRIRSCAIVAHSFGTVIALACMRAQAGEVQSVIFLSPTYRAVDEWWMPLAGILSGVCAVFGRLFPLSSRPRDHVDYEALRPTGDWSLRRIIPDIGNTSIRVYAYCLRHIYADAARLWWKDIHAPVLIVHGAQDSIVSFQNAEHLSQVISGARLILLQGANHILPVNNVEDVLGIIGRFVAEHWTR